MSDAPTATVHQIKNQLAIVLGFSELLARTLDAGDARRADLRQIETAARTALRLLAEPRDRDGGSHEHRS